MAYQTIPPSNSSPDWLTRVWNRVKGINSTLTREPVASNCTNIASDLLVGVATGTGDVSALSTQTEGGGIEITSGGTAGGIRTATLGVSTAAAAFVSNSRTKVWAVYTHFKVVTAPASGAERVILCSLLDVTNDVGLGILASTSTTNWAFTNGAAGGSGVDTTVAFDTNWHEGLLYNDGTNVSIFVDWVQIFTGLSSTYLATTQGVSRTFAYNAAVNGTVNHYMNRWAMFTTEP